MNPIAILIAVERTRELAQSARPNAPVIPVEPPPSRRRDDARASTARWLHLVAERVEPPRRRECAPDL